MTIWMFLGFVLCLVVGYIVGRLHQALISFQFVQDVATKIIDHVKVSEVPEKAVTVVKTVVDQTLLVKDSILSMLKK